MSMILSLKQAPAATLDLLVQRPELAVVFWMNPDFKPAKPSGFVVWLTRLLGGYTPPMELPEAPKELARNGERLDLDKAWHALQWLLTQPKSMSEGDEWQVPPPEGFLLGAGEPIVGSDHGYGDERAASPAEVAAFDDLLKRTPWSELESRFDADALASAQVYPDNWGDSGEVDYVQQYYNKLKDFIAATRSEDLGVVIQLS
ncbi:DUF1877 family protein [Botrimarina mediterranea]|uniref:DUF1877 family protein n=1 Tax=Botrimarina mediterranea TaxID=2528022 RepID=A0A518KCL9_9BACT|nr:DUF1877 family protein [Botrimarina mediterranea]QDV75528.1 hypothetical protein Spa11_37460 [Botrimarina mediterranea]